MSGRAAAAMALLLALAGCAASRRRAEWAAPPQAVEAVYDTASRACAVKVGDATLPTAGRGITRRGLGRVLPRRRVRVMVYAAPAVPTSCPGLVINRLRDAGYLPIGYATR